MSWQPTASTGGRRALAAWFAVCVVFLYVPLLVLMVFSFNDSQIVSWPLSGFTTRWYSQAWHDEQLRDSLITSLELAVVASLVSLVLASLAGLALARNRFRGRMTVYLLLLAPLIMPFLVVGVLLLVFFKVTAVPLSVATVAVGHALVILPYMLLVLVPRLASINPSLEEAARDLGATRLGSYWFVLRPLMVPALVSGFVIGLTISFDEYPVASFLAGDSLTFPIYLYSRLRLPTGQAELIAVASLIIIVSLAAVFLVELGRLIPRRRGSRKDAATATDPTPSLSEEVPTRG